ncbi:hypothetical protein BJM22_03620 [Listeria monocytogenes]|nr:hypothetical protein BJM22_03620 [Listeria monocytogenes]
MNEVFLQELQSFQAHENIWCYMIFVKSNYFFRQFPTDTNLPSKREKKPHMNIVLHTRLSIFIYETFF